MFFGNKTITDFYKLFGIKGKAMHLDYLQFSVHKYVSYFLFGREYCIRIKLYHPKFLWYRSRNSFFFISSEFKPYKLWKIDGTIFQKHLFSIQSTWKCYLFPPRISAMAALARCANKERKRHGRFIPFDISGHNGLEAALGRRCIQR